MARTISRSSVPLDSAETRMAWEATALAAEATAGRFRFLVVLDATSLEVFAFGQAVSYVLPSIDAEHVVASGGDRLIDSLDVFGITVGQDMPEGWIP